MDRFAAALHVTWSVLDNAAEQHDTDASALGAAHGLAFRVRLHLRNDGLAIRGVRWRLHLPTLDRLLAVEERGCRLSHLVGDLHAVDLDDCDMDPGESRMLTFVGESRLRHRPQVLPRWYLSAPDLQPRVIAATDTEDPRDFVSPLPDYADPWRPSDRFHEYTSWYRPPPDGPSPRVRALPTPLHTKSGCSSVRLDNGVHFIPAGRSGGSDGSSAESAARDPQRSDSASNASVAALVELFAGAGIGGGDFPVSLLRDPLGVPTRAREPEGYRLSVTSGGAEIVGADGAGVFYGAMTLLSLYDSVTGLVPHVQVVDAPRLKLRGVMIDLARNMPSVGALHGLIDQMAALKLNLLHLHLSDDEGWRVDIPDLPELAAVGSRRGHTDDERDRLVPLLGAGPVGATGNGFLSGPEYTRLVAAAAARHITVVPEVDMPAHCRAAVMAMEARHDRLRTTDPRAATRFRLREDDDTTRMMTVQHYDRASTINPALPATLDFLDIVVGTIAGYHEAAGQPLRHWHMGGDEAINIFLENGFTDRGDTESGMGQVDRSEQDEPWEGSPAARRLVERGLVDSVTQLPTELVRMVDLIAARHGVSTIVAWQDGLRGEPRAEHFNCRALVDVWETLPQGAAHTFSALSDRGFDVVACTPEFLYFDQSHGTDPDEPGVDWAYPAVHDRRVFSYAPENLAQVAESIVDLHDDPYRLTTPDRPVRLRGIKATLFTEVIRTDERMWHMLFPRLYALAERAWHRADWELDPVPGRTFHGGSTSFVDQSALEADWRTFAEILGRREMPKLARSAIPFRIPPPGGIVRDGVLLVAARYPGLPIQYREGSGPWQDWVAPARVMGPTQIRGGSPQRDRWTEPFDVADAQ